ncbi:unnamed protein product [Miscanthus lutarioriparius]|uniref:Uncharacterized protein n=1 Tax=Miscanthus lutarioriparius TaxID=422564 RepID=A0A811S733_9POAL|nr:unnamed protein product [Miscanthus lutarioriparius]
MASSLVPRIIVLALGAGALGFPDALRLLLDIAGRRSPLTDIAICVFAMAVVTAQALGAMLLVRFVRKAPRAGGDAHAAGAPPSPPPRTDLFAQVTLVVSLGVAFLVSACLLVASGAGARGLGLLCLVVADVARKMKSLVIIAALATGAAVLPCTRPLLRVFGEEGHSQGTATGTGMERFASMTQVASFNGAAAFLLLAVSGGLYIQRGSLVDVAVGVAAARNAAGAGGRAAPASAADTRRVGGKLTRLAPYLAVVSFALLRCLVLTTYAPLESGPDGAKYPWPCSAVCSIDVCNGNRKAAVDVPWWPLASTSTK